MYFLAINLNQGYIEIQFSRYIIRKFCKLALITDSLDSALSISLLMLKNQIKTITIRCQNLAITQTKT